MIEVSKLNGEVLLLNPDLVSSVQISSDTRIHFRDGQSILVKESASQIRQKFIEYKKNISKEYSPTKDL